MGADSGDARALRRRTKVGYGVADLGISGAELMLQLYLLEFYVRAVGLNPFLAGLALALAVLWDAFTDPLMGGIVDHTRSRWGRFIPYLVVGAVVFALGMAALFNPPDMERQGIVFLYLLLTYVFVNTGMTILGVPHIALGGALSTDTHERTELYGWRLVFGTIGLFVGILSPLVAAQMFGMDVATRAGLDGSRRFGSLLMAAAIVLTAAITIGVTWRSTRNLLARSQQFSVRIWLTGVWRLLSSPLFLPFYGAFLLVAMARAMNATLAMPYYKDSLQLPESVIQGVILTTFTVAIVASVPLWVWAGRRFGKKKPAFVGMASLGIMTLLAYPLFPAGALTGPLVAAVIGGIAVGAIILIESMVTDIADIEARRTGEDQEGLAFGLWRMGQKIARSVTLALTGAMLAVIGYEEGLLQQTEATQRRLALAFGWGPGSLFFIASLVFLLVKLEYGPGGARYAIERERRTP